MEQPRTYLKTVPFTDFVLWDVKRYITNVLNSDYPLVSLSTLIFERSERVKLYDFPNEEFKILGVNNKTGLFDAYSEMGLKINQAYKKVYNDDLAYNPYRINVGSIGWKTPNEKNEFISPAYVVFGTNDKLSSEYLYLMFKTEVFNKIIKDNTTGSVRQNLKFESLANIKIPLPPLSEQNRIVSQYNQKIELAQQQEQEANLLEDNLNNSIDSELGIETILVKTSYFGSYLKSAQYNSLNKWGIDLISNEKIKYSKNYAVSKLSQICSISSGGTPSRSRKDYFNGEIPWIKTGEVINDLILDTEEKITQEAIENSSAKLYPKDSLIIAMYGQGKTRGRTAKLGVEATTNQACAVLYEIKNSMVLTDYLWVYLQNEYDRLRELASGNSQPNLNAEMIKNYPVVIPPLSEQKKIINRVFDTQQKIKDLKFQSNKNQQEALQAFEQEIFNNHKRRAPTEYKLIPTVLTVVQKLDMSRAVKNPDGTTTLSLTDPHPSLGRSKLNDRKFKEPEFIQWLIKNGYIQMLWNELFPDKSFELRYSTELKEPFTIKGTKPGDFDIIVFQHQDMAVGIECKIIKYDFNKQIENPHETRRAFNKLRGIDDAWEQLEGYRKLGFHKTYLLLIVLDDQSGNKALGQLSRRMDSKLVTNLANLQPKNDSGIIILYVSQITKYELDVQHIVSLDVLREAVSQMQNDSLTEMIIENDHLF